MSKFENFEKPWGDWPAVNVVHDGGQTGFHVTGKYLKPATLANIEAWWRLLCFMAVPFIVFACLINGVPFGTFVALLAAVPVAVLIFRYGMSMLLSREFDMRILPDRIQLRGGFGTYKDYALGAVHSFALETHANAWAKPKETLYRNAFEIVMYYGTTRVPLLDMTNEQMQRGTSLVVLLQNLVKTVHKAGEHIRPSGQTMPVPRKDFPTPQVR